MAKWVHQPIRLLDDGYLTCDSYPVISNVEPQKPFSFPLFLLLYHTPEPVLLFLCHIEMQRSTQRLLYQFTDVLTTLCTRRTSGILASIETLEAYSKIDHSGMETPTVWVPSRQRKLHKLPTKGFNVYAHDWSGLGNLLCMAFFHSEDAPSLPPIKCEGSLIKPQQTKSGQGTYPTTMTKPSRKNAFLSTGRMIKKPLAITVGVALWQLKSQTSPPKIA